MMRGTDISGYDAGINIHNLTADFVIVKSTEGIQGVRYNPGYRDMADAVLQTNRLLGFYHYANGGDPIAEADCFVGSIIDYRGRAIACLDWEGQGNPTFLTGLDVGWCRTFLDRVRERFGGTPLIYTSKGVCNTYDWSSVACDYPLWGAEYADEDTHEGYDDDPWQSSAPWGAWGHDVAIHQWGYCRPQPNDGGIPCQDCDLAHVTREQWQAWCGSGEVVPTPVTEHISVAERAALIHFDMVSDERNGYSQAPVRWGGDWGGDKLVELPGGSVTYPLGSYDCSSSVCRAWQLALIGSPYEGVLDDATYTGNMREVFLASGLFYADRTPAKRGDVYLNDGHHTAMCQDGGMGDGPFGYDCLSHFRGNEWGGIYDGEPGDQTGEEACVQPFYEAWNTTLHYSGHADWDIYAPIPEVKPEQLPGEPVNDRNIWYRAHVQNAEWMEPVRDGQCAGTVGYSARVEAIKITPPEGVELEVIAHVQGIGNLWFGGVRRGEGSGLGSSDEDPIIGTIGESRRLEAIRVRVTKRPEGLGKLHVQAHVQGVGWLDPVGEDQWAGTRGQSLRLEALRMWFE